MRGGAWLLLLSLCSCGLETAPSLVAPPVDFSDLTLVSDQSLSFYHDAGRYASTSFLGYDVYYKIYPVSAAGNFAQLLSDRSALSSSPTVNQLANLGYRLVSFSSSPTAGAPGIEEGLVQVSADATKVTLDFSDFLSQPTADDRQPLLKLNDVPGAKPYVYRNSSLVGTTNLTFASLRTATAAASDMASWNNSDLTRNQYEVNFFVAAYGLSSSLEPVYSPPVPWGVIRTIGP